MYGGQEKSAHDTHPVSSGGLSPIAVSGQGVPGDPYGIRDADYHVFIAWRSAHGARDEARFYGQTYPICAARRSAASPTSYGTRAAVGLALPPPWTFRFIERPVLQQPKTVRAHLPRGAPGPCRHRADALYVLK